jgi:hypothetical protein
MIIDDDKGFRRVGDHPAKGLGRWVARRYVSASLTLVVGLPLMMFGGSIGLAVTEFAKPYTGESAAMFMRVIRAADCLGMDQLFPRTLKHLRDRGGGTC